jgi:hypothetical protein
MMAISLMLKGTKPCVSQRELSVSDDESETTNKDGKKESLKDRTGKKTPKEKPPKPPKEPGMGLKDRFKGIFTTNLFDEE